MERISTDAVVLGRVDYGETDRVVTLFTRERGKLSAFAAGARKSRRRFSGALEPGNVLAVGLCERRGSTWRLDSAEIRRALFALREDLGRLSRALYVLELCRELLRDEQAHPELFDLLVGYLEGLESGTVGPTSLLAFELEALAFAGLRPRLEGCALCGGHDPGERRFDPEHGGVVCPSCVPRAPGARKLSEETRVGLSRIQAGAKTPLSASIRAEARAVLDGFIAHQLGRSLKSVAFMRQIGVD